jgi:succinyl-diaminopimelate desuccinylase
VPLADRIAADIVARSSELVSLCSELVRIPSPNPPGDTRAVAARVRAVLEEAGLAVEEISDDPRAPNLVATVAGTGPGRHLVLCGHLDVYPVGDEDAWSRPPLSGAVADGRLHGRGAGDMKSGLVTLLAATLALHRARGFAGRLTLLAVSDEMSFSPHGAPLVLERRPDLAGDACIGAEPTSPDVVLIGEKGMLWLEVETTGTAAAGAFAVDVPNAIEAMGALLAELGTLRGRQPLPAVLRPATSPAGGTAGLPPAALTYADDRVLDLVTVNAGTIRGGAKINLVAEHCAATVDIRLPPGGDLDALRVAVAAIVARHPGATSREIQAMAPNWSDPDAEIARVLLDAGERVLGRRPRPAFGITASDTRLFRARGVPAAMIGPRIAGQGAPDESIAVADLVACAVIVGRAVATYLGAGPTVAGSID